MKTGPKKMVLTPEQIEQVWKLRRAGPNGKMGALKIAEIMGVSSWSVKRVVGLKDNGGRRTRHDAPVDKRDLVYRKSLQTVTKIFLSMLEKERLAAHGLG